MKNSDKLEDKTKNNALVIFLIEAILFKEISSQDGYTPYAESLSFSLGQQFSIQGIGSAWTHGFWKLAVNKLEDKGLVSISSIDSQGLPEITLTSYSCFHVVSKNTFDDLSRFAMKRLEIASPNETFEKYRIFLEKAFNGDIKVITANEVLN